MLLLVVKGISYTMAEFIGQGYHQSLPWVLGLTFALQLTDFFDIEERHSVCVQFCLATLASVVVNG